MDRRLISCLRVVILIVALTFIAIGVIRQEHMDVMEKGVRVCLECIGIG